MSITKNGLYNIEGKMFEVVRGVEGDCLTLGDEDGGTRISGPKPWGGGQVTKTFVTREKYGPIERLEEENAKLRELVMAMEPFLCCMPFASCDTLAANVRERMRELGIEVH